MGIFDKIKNAIWGADEDAADTVPAPTANPQTPTAFASAGAPIKTAQADSDRAAPANPSSVSASSAAPSRGTTPTMTTKPVDVGAMLDAAVKRKGQKLDWRHSIVDLMKALDLDSSLADRKELARELEYSGNTRNSAEMNVWLHKALMRKLAENGGRVPPELMD
jgi:disulfide oxidoreductase YuzD